ncbi:BamA/TamA family outer membrane protein [Corallococcus sp. bb12-1]|uniref:BamA/TamA family outer membrane protein n=1 Tax=Corallococcus sp. bb12-1 TaxID=2996784 RepID=UPI0022702DAA|nr:BamA/TamA family outer membrane protein [Corallococcus sp. bb12-1]MCY1047723.1 BamA/TamA family outer membrane protein [Corallococcus sp. bb12-1]
MPVRLNPLRCVSVLAVALLGLGASGARAEEDVTPSTSGLPGRAEVAEVVVDSPGKTKHGTISSYAQVGVGDMVDDEELLKVERRLLSTGLFQEVHVRTEPRQDGRVRLLLEVKDKASWVVAPTVALSSANTGGGLLYAENNLAGRAKKFAAAAQVSTGESGLFMGYLDPLVFGLPQLKFSLEGQLRSDRVDEYLPGASQDDPEIVRRTRLNSASIASELGFILFERVRAAAKYRLSSIDAQSPDAEKPVTTQAFSTGPSLRDTSLRFMVGLDSRQTLHAVTEGLNLEGSYEVSVPGVWSEFRYRKFGVLYRQGLRFFTEQNLILRGELAVGKDLPFHQELVMGGNTLRGFQYRQFRGDTRLTFTAEYHFPLFSIKSLAFRGVGFSDTGVIAFRDLPNNGTLTDANGRVIRGYLPESKSGLDNATVAQGVGAGLRLYLSNVVLPLLGVDVAYGVNSGQLRVYLVAGVTPS